MCVMFVCQFPGPTLQDQDFLLSTRHADVEEGRGSSHMTNSTCRETYNYKHPHPCHPGVDCVFVVRWGEVRTLDEEEEEVGGEWVEFHVTASLSGLRAKQGSGSPHSSDSSVWVALGFSSNRDMVSLCSY